jgi:hypothetical protein
MARYCAAPPKSMNILLKIWKIAPIAKFPFG